jgi:alanyl-tRNA synthetase
MGTHRLYYDDSYLQNFDARLLSCEPCAPINGDSGPRLAWEVVLDRSAFYPTSGGQPNDVGLLDDANVVDVKEEGDEIVHVVDKEVSGSTVKGCVQWPQRFDHMQQHTGQHLLSAMFQERFGLPTVSFHMGAELCTIDLRGPEPSSEVLYGAQRATNKIVCEDRPVNVRYGTADQLAQLGVRKEVEREGILRAIEIEAADLQPCGGTHVKSTGQIGPVLVRRVSKMRQDWRVEFACGSRAEKLATSDFQLLREVAERLGCAPEDVRGAAEKVLSERDAHFKTLRATLQQLAVSWTGVLLSTTAAGANGVRVIAVVLREEHPELLLPLATEIAKNERSIALVAHGETGQFVFAQHASAGMDLAAVLKRVLERHAGKGGGTRDFIRAKLVDAGNAAAALESAKQLLSEDASRQHSSASSPNT